MRKTINLGMSSCWKIIKTMKKWLGTYVFCPKYTKIIVQIYFQREIISVADFVANFFT